MTANDMQPDAQERFWSRYYGHVARSGSTWLDYSNDRVQAQTFGLAIEAAGSILGRRCFDIGCGRGDFSRTLMALRASSVVGVDVVPELIAHHTTAFPEIEWRCGTVQSPGLMEQLGSCDVAFLLEVLQYLPLGDTLRTLWARVRPGGRIVAVVPNANCPIVARARARFGAMYVALTLAQIDAVLSGLPDVEDVQYRGLSFGANQRVVPYQLSAWGPAEEWQVPPNRIQFVAVKRDTPPS